MSDLYIDFDAGTALTGTCTFTNAAGLTGSGTLFLTELAVGDYVRASTVGGGIQWYKVTVITDDLTATLEKVRDEKTGQPLAVPERITEQVFLPSFLAQTLKYNEGAMRGMQEQTCKQSGKIDAMEDKMQLIGNILMQTENSLKCLATSSDGIKQIKQNKFNLVRE